jgi:heat shock protein HtpX
MNPTFKTMFWLTVLTLLFLAAGHLVGGPNGVVLALVLSVITNLVAYFYSDKIVLAMYRARPISEEEAPHVHRILDELSQNAGSPKPPLYLIPSESPNAFATGRGPGHAVVAVTTGITRLVDERELRAVLAHELGHVVNRDVLLSTVVAMIVGVVATLGSMARWQLFFGGFGGRDRDDEGPHPIVYVLVLAVIGLAATLVQLAISRARELAADETGARLSGTPLALASALQKIEYAAHQVPLEANPGTAHLFIVQPLTGGGIMSLLATHPPVEQRVERLEHIAQDIGVAA